MLLFFNYLLRVFCLIIIFISFKNYRLNKEISQKALSITLVVLLLLAVTVFLFLKITKGFSIIESTQHYEIITPLIVIGILNFNFLIWRYRNT